MRPPAPVPLTRLKSILFSRAQLAHHGESGPAGSAAGAGSSTGGGAAGLPRHRRRRRRTRGGRFGRGLCGRLGGYSAVFFDARHHGVDATVLPSSTITSASVRRQATGFRYPPYRSKSRKSGSSRSTWSPGFFSHLVSVPSTMLSPIWGITTSVISVLSFGRLHRRRAASGIWQSKTWPKCAAKRILHLSNVACTPSAAMESRAWSIHRVRCIGNS